MKYKLTYSHKYPKKILDLYKRRVFQLAENKKTCQNINSLPV